MEKANLNFLAATPVYSKSDLEMCAYILAVKDSMSHFCQRVQKLLYAWHTQKNFDAIVIRGVLCAKQ